MSPFFASDRDRFDIQFLSTPQADEQKFHQQQEMCETLEKSLLRKEQEYEGLKNEMEVNTRQANFFALSLISLQRSYKN